MNATVARELAVFSGTVHCRAGTGAVNLELAGVGRAREGARVPLTVSFAGAQGAPEAGALSDVRVFELPTPCRYRIDGAHGSFELQARSVQVQRDVGALFFGAVPPPKVPRGTRWGWTVLLTLLRLPGVARLLMRLRGAR